MSKTWLKVRFKPAAKATVLLIALGGQVVAQQAPETNTLENANFVERTGGDQRINFSGKLRMLSQRMPAAACNLHAGVVPTSSRTALNAAVEEFDTILDALEFGDDSLGIFGPEDRVRTLRVIQEVHTKLTPIKEALATETGETLSSDTVTILADQNMALLDIAKLLVSELSGQYSNPVALVQSDAMAIDIAGRQRMLTQKMSKEVCLALSDINADEARAALQSTMNMFEVSLGALQNGMEQVGITPPPNAEIASGLVTVETEWRMVRGFVDTVLSGGTLDEEQRGLVFDGLSATLREMNTVVGMYATASQQNL